MLVLPEVTLCCIDTANHALALRALAQSGRDIRFARTLFLTHRLPAGIDVPENVEVIAIDPLTSREAYSQFVLKALAPYLRTSHLLLVQWDGYVVNAQAWDPAFLVCDYLGAKWFWHNDGMRVGNGGFSLRSHRLLQALADPRITLAEAEDLTIGRHFRPLLEADHGIRFGDEALADRFSFEAAYPVGRPFGFHGLFNFCRTVPPDELTALAPTFTEAIARSPQLAQLLRNCTARGQWQAAAAIAGRILAAQPDAVEAATLLAQAQRHLAQPATVGRNEPCPCGSGRKFKQCHGALDAARDATSATQHDDPRHGTPAQSAAGPVNRADIDDLVARALAAHQRGDVITAEQGYRQALSQVDEHPLAMHYLGVILYQRREVDAALPLLERAVQAVPHEPEFHNNLGLALAAADRDDDAIASYRRALALKPDHAVAWNNLGLALQATNRLPEAIAAFRDALAHEPQFGQAHWNLALALLAQGEFEEGWREYEWRLALTELGRVDRLGVGPRWDGIARPGSTLLLTAEQGLGDALQFVRFAAPLAARGLRVVVQAPATLLRLLATAPGVSAVHAFTDPLPAHDAHLPLLSTAGALGVTADTIPQDVPYLTADGVRRAAMLPQAVPYLTANGVRRAAMLPQAVPYLTADGVRRAAMRDALAPHAGAFKIGVAWAGSPLHGNDRRRSMRLDDLRPLLAMPDIAWFSLQRNAPPPGEAVRQSDRVQSAAQDTRLIEWPARNADTFDDTAALVAELDLVLTIDTSLAHLAGALGKPAWVMLPYAPDWRWRLGRADSPWYPTLRLFRQPQPGDWAAVVRDIAAALRSMRDDATITNGGAG